MSISRGLSYDVKIKFLDHALVFMLRGIRRKWKQVVAHVFVEHSIKKEKKITIC